MLAVLSRVISVGHYDSADDQKYRGDAAELTRASGETVAGSPYAISQGSLASNANYTISFADGTLTITKAVPVITWNNPADIVYGTALSGTQLNATANTAGNCGPSGTRGRPCAA